MIHAGFVKEKTKISTIYLFFRHCLSPLEDISLTTQIHRLFFVHPSKANSGGFFWGHRNNIRHELTFKAIRFSKGLNI